jgi:pimeloyl-ACP methyl ester carboxylesterase
VNDEDGAPPLSLLLREVSAFATMRAKASFAPAVPGVATGHCADVLVFPGFMASDRTTARLRKSLDLAGHRAHGWGLGRNGGVTADMLQRIDARLDRMEPAGPVTLIGWSLGGLIAREYAKFAPHRVAKVITLGSPFSGSPRANNAWRIYEFIAGHKVDAPPIDTILCEKPPVPTIAFWSRQDGVVAAAAARGAVGEVDESHEMACTHMAFVADPDVIRAIIAEVGRSA